MIRTVSILSLLWNITEPQHEFERKFRANLGFGHTDTAFSTSIFSKFIAFEQVQIVSFLVGSELFHILEPMMVGVPGRSKACHTCRHRRIKVRVERHLQLLVNPVPLLICGIIMIKYS